MNIFCHIPRENWIVDRMGLEFKNRSSHTVSFTEINKETDVIWLLGSWCWDHIPTQILDSFRVVCTIHHEVPEKFTSKRRENFIARDRFVDFYLTYTEDTKKLINSLSKKPVEIIPHWINTEIWKKLDRSTCVKELNLPENKFLIGSFQRDTEGSDLTSPKLEKGPDIFVEKVCEISKFKDVHVVLGGWRRQFVINKLNENNIPYTYFELPSNDIVNKMYNALDLYIISSRCEGGPQSLFECAYLEIPQITTRVGQHIFIDDNCKYSIGEILTDEKLEKSKLSISANRKNIDSLLDYNHIEKYDDYFKNIEQKDNTLRE